MALAELRDRIEVLNARIEQLEEARESPVAAPASAPEAPAVPRAAADSGETMGQPAREEPPMQTQRALAGADLADAYRRAIDLMSAGRHEDARRAFLEVFESDPNGDLADNALFRIGESHLATGEAVEALRFFRRVVAEYPDQNKAPEALLRSAIAIERTGDLALARTTLNQVIETWPYSEAAAAAKAELKRIRF